MESEASVENVIPGIKLNPGAVPGYINPVDGGFVNENDI
jgi:hypothetical protein